LTVTAKKQNNKFNFIRRNLSTNNNNKLPAIVVDSQEKNKNLDPNLITGFADAESSFFIGFPIENTVKQNDV
jgi:hypothetical protein